MNPIQTKLEQVFKEYIEFRDYVESNKKPAEEIRKEIAEKVTSIEDDSYLDIMFKEYGERQLEAIDLNQMSTRLYYYYNAYKDLVEVPEEIKTEAEKIDIKFLFAIKNGKREIADKELYNSLKTQFVEANKEAQKN
jgi:hypothetical protein